VSQEIGVSERVKVAL